VLAGDDAAIWGIAVVLSIFALASAPRFDQRGLAAKFSGPPADRTVTGAMNFFRALMSFVHGGGFHRDPVDGAGR